MAGLVIRPQIVICDIFHVRGVVPPVLGRASERSRDETNISLRIGIGINRSRDAERLFVCKVAELPLCRVDRKLLGGRCGASSSFCGQQLPYLANDVGNLAWIELCPEAEKRAPNDALSNKT